MLNMVAPEELLDDADYEDTLLDVKEECEKYGKVLEVRIPRPKKNDKGKIDNRASEGVRGLGKVYVMFEEVGATMKAMKAVAGRQFAGRTVICAFATEETLLSLE